MTPSGNVQIWITVAAGAAYLAFGVAAVVRGGRSPLALLLAALSADLLVWNGAALAHALTGVSAWHWLDRAASPFTTPLTLHIVLAFVGRRRALRAVLAATYAAFALLSLATLAAFVAPAWRLFADSHAWAVLHLAGVVPAVALAIALLLRHLRSPLGAVERARTRLLLVALLIGGVFGSTDLLAGAGLPVPRLGTLATLASTAIVAVVALRLRLLDGPAATARRTRIAELATLGRFSAQMAHDIKNPLAALKGAVQFLQEERAQGRPLAERGELLDLIAGEVDRVALVVDQYQRLGRVEPVRVPLDANDVVRGVLALQRFAAAPGVTVSLALDPALARCRADRDLLAGALGNLVRNAFEAMPGGGTLTVSTGPASPGEGEGIFVSVGDTGSGMDARTRERALDDFYSTKPGGTGHGLAFVRRVAEAHGGEVTISSAEGRGTVVRIHLPA